MDYIAKLITTQKTVFSTEDIVSVLNSIEQRGVESFLRRAKKDGRLLNPQKGIWTLPVFDVHELACVFYPKGYISLETVLYEAGVIFQRYGSSTRMVRSNTREKIFQDHHYIARKIKDELLYNTTGVRKHQDYYMATPERALCDYIYLRPQAQLDNPQYFQNPQSRVRLNELLPFYPQTVQKYVQKLLLSKI